MLTSDSRDTPTFTSDCILFYNFQAGVYSTMQSVTNPYECEIGGRAFIGTSGQNVKDILRCSEVENPLDVLERICEWGHLAPTAPDTLSK